MLAHEAGRITGKLHEAGYAFVDNKAQNYLVRGDTLIRTDLGFMKKTHSHYSRSMDIGSFLASVMDLERYREIINSFHDGYLSESAQVLLPLDSHSQCPIYWLFIEQDKITLRNMLPRLSHLDRCLDWRKRCFLIKAT